MNEAVYTLVLTHDIDAMTLAELPPGRTLAGFFYRCLVENLGKLVSGRISLGRYLASVSAVGTFFPAKLGIGLDVWARSLGRMLSLEREWGVRSTLFVIPIARQAGVMPGNGNGAPRQRAAHYRIQDWSQLLRRLVGEGWEVGVHGLNAWRSEADARAELAVLRQACPEQARVGVRMHWLYSRPGMWEDLEAAGYAYDATLGWNDRVGFPEGRYRPFRPEGTREFMVLPLNIQDGALLSREYRNLDLRAAWRVAQGVLNEARSNHGVVTLLWHNTSFVAPRFWGDLYERLVRSAQEDGARVVPAGLAVQYALSPQEHEDHRA